MASRRPSNRSVAAAPPANQTVFPKTSLTKSIPEDSEDSEDQSRSKESRPRTQKPQPSSSRREDQTGSDEPPAEDHRRGKQKTTTKPSHLENRRSGYDGRDDDRYGGSRRDSGNRSRDQTESRYSSSTTALVKHGESSRAVSKRDGRSKAYTKDTGSTRAKLGHSDEEEDVKISRYVHADFEKLLPEAVLELSNLLDVRAGKIKQWCERDLIRRDNTTGTIDIKPLVKEVDEEDAKKLRGFMKKLEDEKKAAKIFSAHSQHHGDDHSQSHHSDDHFQVRPHLCIPRSYTGPSKRCPRCCYTCGNLCHVHHILVYGHDRRS